MRSGQPRNRRKRGRELDIRLAKLLETGQYIVIKMNIAISIKLGIVLGVLLIPRSIIDMGRSKVNNGKRNNKISRENIGIEVTRNRNTVKTKIGY